MDTTNPASFGQFLRRFVEDMHTGKVSRLQASHIIESLLMTLDELRRNYSTFSPDSTETVRIYMLSSLDEYREALILARDCNEGHNAGGKLDRAHQLIEEGTGLLKQVELLALENDIQVREE